MDTNEVIGLMVHDLRTIGKETGWSEPLLLQGLIDDLWKIQDSQRWARLTEVE